MANIGLRPASELISSKASAETKNVIDSVNSVWINTKLKQILEERKMSQIELSELTGIPRNQISAFVNNKKNAKLAYHHIIALMVALRLTDISQLLYFDISEEERELFDTERQQWIETRREPLSIQQLRADNMRIAEDN